MSEPRKRSIAGQTLVYFGDGKGKTTSAFGVALRAVGRGWKVLMIQFTKMGEWPKGEPMGEISGALRLAPDFEVISTGIGFVNIFGDPYTLEEHRDAAQKGLNLYRQRAASGEYDLIILDEIIGAVSQGQIDLPQLLDVLRDRPRELNLLVTGHDDEHQFIDQVIELADLATEMKKVRHPFDQGHQARKGLDY
ncbi:MAG TPA: cob(I)yrinic acid a,c-diamide adenosyltransferase [Chloroflexota bacterium]|nr:cob(I)yrinic acid a,c-diamide adenosyltransferase [Chloroflexota bacterium]